MKYSVITNGSVTEGHVRDCQSYCKKKVNFPFMDFKRKNVLFPVTE